MSEIKSNPEALPQNAETLYEGYFSALSTSEMHALTYVLMTIGEGPYSRKQMRNLCLEAQGTQPVWRVATNLNFSYSTDKFEPAGLTTVYTESRILINRNHSVNVLVTDIDDQVDTEYALAVCGAELDWSLSHPQPLRSFFGESRKDARAGSAAVSRRKILDSLRDQPDLSEVEMANALQVPTSYANSYLNDLVADGIVLKEEASDWDKRLFKLNGKGYQHIAIKRSDTSPETRAIYSIVDAYAMSGTEDISAQALYDKIIDLHPELDRQKVQHILAQALTGKQLYRQGNREFTTQSIISIDSEGAFNEGRKTKYRINPELAEPLNDLLDTLGLIDKGDHDFRQHYAQRAIEIAEDPELVRKIVEKAQSASPHKNTIPDSRIMRIIDEVVSTEGELSIGALGNALRDRGVVMSHKGLSKRITDLNASGVLALEVRPQDNKSTRMVRFILGSANRSTSKD
jgi:hypothetical protein